MAHDAGREGISSTILVKEISSTSSCIIHKLVLEISFVPLDQWKKVRFRKFFWISHLNFLPRGTNVLDSMAEADFCFSVWGWSILSSRIISPSWCIEFYYLWWVWPMVRFMLFYTEILHTCIMKLPVITITILPSLTRSPCQSLDMVSLSLGGSDEAKELQFRNSLDETCTTTS